MGTRGVVLVGLLLALVFGGLAVWRHSPDEPPRVAMATGGAVVDAASRPAPAAPVAPGAVPLEDRRQHAGTCIGYNLELEEVAASQDRQGHPREAARLRAMKQPCESRVSPFARSAGQ